MTQPVTTIDADATPSQTPGAAMLCATISRERTLSYVKEVYVESPSPPSVALTEMCEKRRVATGRACLALSRPDKG